MLLAFIEDSAGDGDPRRAPAFHRLSTVFGFSNDFLNGLLDYAKKERSFPDFPEEILLKWELASAPTLSQVRRGD